jgi:hypothetical protein
VKAIRNGYLSQLTADGKSPLYFPAGRQSGQIHLIPDLGLRAVKISRLRKNTDIRRINEPLAPLPFRMRNQNASPKDLSFLRAALKCSRFHPQPGRIIFK